MIKGQVEDVENTLEASHSLRHELEQTRRELDECRGRLAQVDEQLQAHKKAETLLHGQKHLTEMIARGDPLEAILEDSCKLVEKALPGSLAVIMRLDGNRLRRGAAPSLPEYVAEVDGFEIGHNVGTCSAAAARGVPVITSDIFEDPNWAGLLDLAAKFGLRAGVHLSYDRMASFLSPYANAEALRVAQDLDAKVEALIASSAG